MLIAAATEAASQTQTATGGDDWKFIAALVAAAVGILTLWINGRRNERQRRRELYAGAWAAVQAYKEFPFVVRRRRDDAPAEERVRISEAMREVQKDLSYYEALVGRERSGRVAAEYRNLVAKTREVAGGLMRDGWNAGPITTDAEMNMPDVAKALQELRQFEEPFLNAMQDDLAWWNDFLPRGR